jgi:hypothetical protein
MFETKNIVLILVILLLILLAYKMSTKSENLNSESNTKFLQDFIKNQTDNSGNFKITDLSNNTIMNFKIMNDITSLDNINVLNDNKQGILINNDNNMLLMGKYNNSSFIYSINDISITSDNSGNHLNLVAVTPTLNYINPNQIQFKDGMLTIIVDNSGNAVNFPLNINDKNPGAKLISYSDFDKEKYGFGIKLPDGTKKLIAFQTDISKNLKKYYPENNNLIKDLISTSLINNLQDYLKNYKK